MSWELMNTTYKNCQCAEKGITFESYMDDWNRTDERVFINCEFCSTKFNLISKGFMTNKGEHFKRYYLFPKEINLPIAKRIIISQPKIEAICNEYPLNNLKKIYELIEKETNIKRISEQHDIVKIFAKFYKWKNQTQKINLIKEDLVTAIYEYQKFNTNFDITNEKYMLDLSIEKEIWEKHAIKI